MGCVVPLSEIIPVPIIDFDDYFFATYPELEDLLRPDSLVDQLELFLEQVSSYKDYYLELDSPEKFEARQDEQNNFHAYFGELIVLRALYICDQIQDEDERSFEEEAGEFMIDIDWTVRERNSIYQEVLAMIKEVGEEDIDLIDNWFRICALDVLLLRDNILEHIRDDTYLGDRFMGILRELSEFDSVSLNTRLSELLDITVDYQPFVGYASTFGKEGSRLHTAHASIRYLRALYRVVVFKKLEERGADVGFMRA